MRGEIHVDLVDDLAVLDLVVEGGHALEILQPVDDGEAAIVAEDDDELVAGQHVE